jgi:LEA14-like dessication related protein
MLQYFARYIACGRFTAPRLLRASRLAGLGLVALSALSAGCALVPHYEKPTLELVNLKLADGNLLSQRFNARLKVHNPNDRSLPVNGLHYTVDIDGKVFGRGASERAFIVPARGEAEFDMTLDANLAGAIGALLQRREKANGREVEYRLKGTVNIDLPLLRSIDFDQVGHFRF